MDVSVKIMYGTKEMAQVQNGYLYCCLRKAEIDAQSSIFDSMMFLMNFVGDGTDLIGIE